jgi:hypothetical protein
MVGLILSWEAWGWRLRLSGEPIPDVTPRFRPNPAGRQTEPRSLVWRRSEAV